MLFQENIHNGLPGKMYNKNNTNMKRAIFVEHNQQRMDLPLFFPSISSVKTNFRPIDYLHFIKASGCHNFLISAYDIFHQNESDKVEMIDLLNSMQKEGALILLDSGNYESYWHRDNNWTIDKNNEILKNDFCSFCFSFDYQKIESMNKNELTKIAIANSVSNQMATKGTIAPIIHAKPEDLAYVCQKVIQHLTPKIIAIPERLLGSGIIARVKRLRQIRISLNELGYYTPIHLLGTGNPFSLLLFSYAGADSFDGLEWCQTYIDEKTFHVHHFQLRDLFCSRGVNVVMNYEVATLFNNIRTYQNINKLIQEGFNNNNMIEIMKKYFLVDVIKKLYL